MLEVRGHSSEEMAPKMKIKELSEETGTFKMAEE